MAFNLDLLIIPVHGLAWLFSRYRMLFYLFTHVRDDDNLSILLSLLLRNRFAASETVPRCLALSSCSQLSSYPVMILLFSCQRAYVGTPFPLHEFQASATPSSTTFGIFIQGNRLIVEQAEHILCRFNPA